MRFCRFSSRGRRVLGLKLLVKRLMVMRGRARSSSKLEIQAQELSRGKLCGGAKSDILQ